MADRNYKTTEAHRARSKRWYEANKDRSAARARKYNLKHREDLNAHRRKWRAAKTQRKRAERPLKPRLSPEEVLERKREATRKWRAAHPDAASRNSREWKNKNRAKILAERGLRAAQARAYRAANLEASLERERRWKENNPDKVREYNRNRKARLLSKDGRHTARDIEMLYQLQEGLLRRLQLLASEVRNRAVSCGPYCPAVSQGRPATWNEQSRKPPVVMPSL